MTDFLRSPSSFFDALTSPLEVAEEAMEHGDGESSIRDRMTGVWSQLGVVGALMVSMVFYEIGVVVECDKDVDHGVILAACDHLKHVNTALAWFSFMSLSATVLMSTVLYNNISSIPDAVVRTWLIESKWAIGLPSHAFVAGASSYLVLKNVQNLLRNDGTTAAIGLSVSAVGSMLAFYVHYTIRGQTVRLLKNHSRKVDMPQHCSDT
eukprot:TRINITY_DN63257_c0_g1_i1.p1 TRINITY_DN63257_c0_g1~~TRINITY_DN63257_c0_g1_i1.p1  ORF type:complete len:208 (-),score=37.91 TRINITY_DN63257_c0_g1_i1:209-832(-)